VTLSAMTISAMTISAMTISVMTFMISDDHISDDHLSNDHISDGPSARGVAEAWHQLCDKCSSVIWSLITLRCGHRD
jgi:hypothetical protein